ncbi:MAG: InlB B-repeat-containing protein, partial [Clostridia bacterium]|nr:InlB B-repeat-containing protein [Clostridia bacterium]
IIGSDFDIPIPEKDGFVFEGWANEYGEIVALPLQMPLYDMNFKAVWNKAEPEMYMVNFNFMGDVPEGYEIPGSFICEAGLVVNCPEIPVVEGYTFDGWYYNDKICESFIMPSNDVVLRGVWTANEFKIILDAEEGEFIDGSHQFTEKVPCGYSLSSVIPPEPTREGFEFMGWVDENGLMADMPSYMPEHDLILTAVWKTNVHTVYIDVDGDVTEYARFAYGDEIDLPPTPEKDGYMFAGWRVIDINGDEAIVPTVMPDCDLTFIAQWEEIIPDTHTVSYYLAAGGELYRTEVYEEGETINYYMPSSVEGLVFRGWVDENGDELPAMMGTDDIVAYAVFEPAKYTVTFIIGKETVSETFNYGSPVNVPEISSEYVIAKWVDENGDEVKFPINTLNRDMTVTAECRYVAKVEELDISVEYGDGCFDEDVKLVIDDLTDDKINGNQSTTGNINYHEVKENGKTARPVGFYNIKMVKSDGKTAQPNKNTFVTVTMKIPDGYTGKTEFKLYHWYTTGGYEIISTSSSERKITRNGDYLIFDIYSFSNFELFVIIDESALVSKLPKTNYNYKGGSIDLSGIELKIPNGDGTYETVTDTSKMTVSGFDSSKVGDQTVRVEYQGTSAEYKVSVSYTWWQWIIRILLLGFIWY